VEEFWDDIADASLPPTRPLQMVSPEMRRKPSADLSVEPEEEFTEAAPPRPHFDIPAQRPPVLTELDSQRRPRIVVPINLGIEARRQRDLQTRQDSRFEADRRFENVGPLPASVLPASRKRRALVALGLILAFSGMLLATHKYVTTRWNPLSTVQNVEPVVIGRQGVTTTDVNLRPVASSANNVPIGLAESGSKVKVLSLNADNNWCEVQVVEHARPKIDPYSSDRGWIRKIYVKFD
jgi:hypothetical protein